MSTFFIFFLIFCEFLLEVGFYFIYTFAVTFFFFSFRWVELYFSFTILPILHRAEVYFKALFSTVFGNFFFYFLSKHFNSRHHKKLLKAIKSYFLSPCFFFSLCLYLSLTLLLYKIQNYGLGNNAGKQQGKRSKKRELKKNTALHRKFWINRKCFLIIYVEFI